MIATGTDVKPLECVVFMRDARSAQYFEQMKGRGARTIPDADFQSVTPDAQKKTGFVIVDAIGVTEHPFMEPPLNRQRSKPGDREDSDSPVFHLRNGKQGVDATAQQIDGEFTMLAGSAVVPAWQGVGKADSTRKAYASYRAQHEQLVADGAIVVEAGRGRVTRNIPFTSPSTAGAVALGRSCNGRREWISADGSTFGHWESRGIE